MEKIKMNLTHEEVFDYIKKEYNLHDKLLICELSECQIYTIQCIVDDLLWNWSKVLIDKINNESK